MHSSCIAGRHLGLGQSSAPDYVARLQITHNSLNLGFLITSLFHDNRFSELVYDSSVGQC